MELHQQATAQSCLDGSYGNTMTFRDCVKALAEAGFDGYHVDYRLNTRTYYLPNGETLELTNPHVAGPVAPEFNQAGVADAIKWAQSCPSDCSYIAFNTRVTANGCAGYIVSLLGRRVLYFGRTAETHVEPFPHPASGN